MKINSIKAVKKLSNRMFTFNQLLKISDDNHDVLTRCVNMSAFNEEDIFECSPVMIHHHAFGEPMKPHLGTLVTMLTDQYWFAFQDMTFEQWEQGDEI